MHDLVIVDRIAVPVLRHEADRLEIETGGGVEFGEYFDRIAAQASVANDFSASETSGCSYQSPLTE